MKRPLKHAIKRGDIAPAVPVSYGAEALAVFAAMGTAPSTSLKGDINTAILALQAVGVWADLDTLYVQQVEAANQFLDWKNPGLGTPATQGAPTFVANRGFDYDGVDDKHVLYNATTFGGAQYTQNSNCGFVRTMTSVQYTNPVIGLRNGTTSTATMNPRSTGDLIVFRAQDTTGGETNADVSGNGMYAWNRSGAAARQLYRNGAALGLTNPTAASVALVNIAFHAGGAAASSGVAFAACRLAFCGFGKSMSAQKHLDLYTAMEDYVQARLTH